MLHYYSIRCHLDVTTSLIADSILRRVRCAPLNTYVSKRLVVLLSGPAGPRTENCSLIKLSFQSEVRQKKEFIAVNAVAAFLPKPGVTFECGRSTTIFIASSLHFTTQADPYAGGRERSSTCCHYPERSLVTPDDFVVRRAAVRVLQAEY